MDFFIFIENLPPPPKICFANLVFLNVILSNREQKLTHIFWTLPQKRKQNMLCFSVQLTTYPIFLNEIRRGRFFGGGGSLFPFIFLQISVSYRQIRLHPKCHLTKPSGCGLKVYGRWLVV